MDIGAINKYTATKFLVIRHESIISKIPNKNQTNYESFM